MPTRFPTTRGAAEVWAVGVCVVMLAALAARGETPAAFGRRCIPADCVAPPSNIPDILRRRALSSGRLAALGATPDFHHGLLALAAQLGGEAASGRRLVDSSQCLDCHRIGETGSRLGPDLSDIGSRRSFDVLRRAIVAPDDEVLPEHRFVRLVTKDGTVVAGRLLNQDAFSIQLINVEEQLRSYLKSNLREHAILDKGLMPSFDGKLTAQQITDIVSYLATLKGAEK
jgi:putative heme-binding domain-containing protein